MPNKTPKQAIETIGVIDIGTNSVRLQIAEVYDDGQTEVMEKAWLPVRLGQDTFVKRQLSRRSMNAAISVLRGYQEMLDTYQVDHIRAVATSAVREANNADAFLDRIFMSTGLDVEIIEPTEEIRLTVSAVRDSLGAKELGRGYAVVTDIGGGSALLALLQHGQIIASGSYALGSIRLQESLDTSGESPQRAADMLRQQIASVVRALSQTMKTAKARKFIAVGGDARFAAHQLGRPGSNEHTFHIDRQEFLDLVERLENHSPEELAREFKMPFSDAETLVPALLVYEAVLNATAAKELTVSDVSMRDGLMRDLALQAVGKRDTEEITGAVRSAMTVVEKYQCDEAHAKHVADLAVRLFDELQDEHHLQPRQRLLLQVAALLHEVGGFISGRAHHKHSHYIISNTELFGLRAGEKDLVANIARYHRRSIPKPSHMPYMTLPREQRVIVSKLAAILRIADALERGHTQQVKDFRVEHHEDEIVIFVKGVTDLALERRALETKADLFEDIFGLTVRLEEV